MIRIVSILVLVLCVILWCCKPEPEFNPSNQLTGEEKREILTRIVRYVVKPPENVSPVDKFSTQYDEYYAAKLSEIRLDQYYQKDDEIFFLVSKPATHLKIKWHATGGKFKINGAGDLIDYEEIFRTWKMTPDTLKARSYFLFEKMVKEEPLEPYYTKNSKRIELIEFPDDRTFFDKNSRAWKQKE
jgi:hypothetical protein